MASATSSAPTVSRPDRVGGPVRVAWREGTLTRAKELEALSSWLCAGAPDTSDDVLMAAIRQHLEAARDAAHMARLNPRRWFRSFRSGALLERATSNLDAAEAHMLSLAPTDYLLGQVPGLLQHVQCNLRHGDPRRLEFERIAVRAGIKDPDHPLLKADDSPTVAAKEKLVDEERRTIVGIVRGASSVALRDQIRLRSFRNIVVITALLMAVLAVGVAIIGFFSPTLIPLCFAPEEAGTTVVVCPTGQSAPFIALGDPPMVGVLARDLDEVIAETVSPVDLLVVELVGLIAAAVATAAAIRRIKGSAERYSLPVALAALKLPTGAITAFLGLLLMRAQFVPGLTALDTAAQILGWALLFGYAQELLTRLVDMQGQTVLDNVRGANRPQSTPSTG